MAPYTHPAVMDLPPHFMDDDEARHLRGQVYREQNLHQQRPFERPLPDIHPLQRHYVHDHPEQRDPHFWSPGCSNPHRYVEHVAPTFPMPSMAIPEHLNAPHFMLAQTPPHLPQASRRPDDVDSSCRPRLSTHQTSHLEEMYRRNPRPTTNEKKAIAQNLCLPQDKNWFQNRRAKSKQQNKSHKSVELYRAHQTSPPEHEQPGVATPVSTVEQVHSAVSTEQSESFHSSPVSPEEELWNLGHRTIGQTAMATNQEAAVSPISHDPTISAPNEMDPALSFQPVATPSSIQTPEDLWASFDMTMPTAHPSGELLLEQSTPIAYPQPSDIAYLEALASQHAVNEATPHRNSSERSEVPSDTIIVSSHPSHSPSTSLPREDTSSSDLSRQNSGSSGLNNSLSTTPQSSSEDELLKYFDIGVKSNLAMRRRRHPVALNSMRTTSASQVSLASLSTDETIRPLHVRRISSTGNGLNVARGRIQKTQINSNARSPLRRTFFESSPNLCLHNPLTAHGSENSQNLPEVDTSFTQEHHQGFDQFACSPTEYESSWPTSSPSDLNAPPLSACHTQLSFDDGSYATSPPITPFTQQPQCMSQWAEMEIPQSAPANVAHFPSHSPPMQPQPDRGAVFMTPQPQHPINGFVNGAECFQAPQMFPQAFPGHPAMFDLNQQPFWGQSQEPAATLQINIAEFPPAPVQLKQRVNHSFAFHNQGPKDYEDQSKAQTK